MLRGVICPLNYLEKKMRYKLIIEYDGTNVLGWQRQLDGPSVQQYLEDILEKLNGSHTEVVSAGRTDAGVHALRQVVHIDLKREMEPWKIREAFNGNLLEQGAPVTVLEAEAVDDAFHARFSAQKRAYIYRILNRRSPSPLLKDRVWWVPFPLNVEKMRQAASYLVGHHDFSSFRAAACQAKSPVKTLDKIEISVQGEEIVFYVEARSFLHHQVRNIVGTLKMVGDGHLSPEDVKAILEARDRKAAGPTAPAGGLYLCRVDY